MLAVNSRAKLLTARMLWCSSQLPNSQAEPTLEDILQKLLRGKGLSSYERAALTLVSQRCELLECMVSLLSSETIDLFEILFTFLPQGHFFPVRRAGKPDHLSKERHL